ncbi:MAG: NifB/NifX family molybdenum-iron cluster-binding protein [Bacteroidota bacterium]
MVMIAVPSRDGMVDEHFGHCEAFSIFRLKDGTLSLHSNLTPPVGCGCQSNIIPSLIELGVSVLVAGNMGGGAANLLAQHGITVCRGASGPVDKAVAAWAAGTLKDQDQLCQSHDCAGH